MLDELKEETLRWKIDKDLQLYQFYLDMSVKVAVFLMTVTGAMASYVLANGHRRVPSAALIFPVIMNGGFAVLFFFSIKQARKLYKQQREECERLRISKFNMGPLKSVCLLFALMCAVTTLGLIGLIAWSWGAPS